MNWKKFLALPLAALLLLGTACSESTPTEYSKPDGYVEPTPTPEVSEFRSLGETIPYDGEGVWIDWGMEYSKMEATVNKVQLFENFADSGISEEELSSDAYNREGNLPEPPFVLLDVTIKKLEGLEELDKGDLESWDYMTFALCSKRQREYCKETQQDVMWEDMSYFSGHDDSAYDYWSFWLDVGEEKDYQIGCFLMDPNFGIGLKDWDPEVNCLSTDRDLLLAVGNGMNGYYYEFVDLEPELE